MDEKGYIISGLSFLLIIPAIYLVIVFADISNAGSQSQGLLIRSDVVFSTARDVEGNIPFMAEKTMQKTADEVILKGEALNNSRIIIKDSLQGEVDGLTQKYRDNEKINVTCQILAVDSAADPFKVQVNSTISVNKDNVIHRENISQDISIIDPNCPISDPLPFIKCKSFGGITNTSSRIVYNSSLANFLKSRNSTNPEAYMNATSPLIFKKCPYDPYKTHGESNNMTDLKNCLDNGFYHESSDGACFLCRLEGKGKCSHYGMETFIIPHPSGNDSLNSSTCSSDHVIFNDNYTGYEIIYYSNSTDYFKIYLDNGHRAKYGLI